MPGLFRIKRYSGKLVRPAPRPADDPRSRLREAHRERCSSAVRRDSGDLPAAEQHLGQFVSVIEYYPVAANDRRVSIAQVPIARVIRAPCIVNIVQTARELVLSLERQTTG